MPVVARGEPLRLLDQLHQAGVEALAAADHLEADAVGVQPRHFLLQHGDEQLHQEADFFLGPPPILAAEGEQGQVLDAQLAATAGHRAHRVDALAMPRHPRQEAALRPAAVAVHDHGDVPRDRRGAGNVLCRALVVGHGRGADVRPPSDRLPWP
jgi:hypothetical protein